MMKITTATEALCYPCAQLNEDDRMIVGKLVGEINEAIRTKMRRNGFEFETSNTNAAAQFEVNALLVHSEWDVNCQPLFKMSRFQGAQPEHIGYKVSCTPSKAAIIERMAAAKLELQ